MRFNTLKKSLLVILLGLVLFGFSACVPAHTSLLMDYSYPPRAYPYYYGPYYPRFYGSYYYGPYYYPYYYDRIYPPYYYLPGPGTPPRRMIK